MNPFQVCQRDLHNQEVAAAPSDCRDILRRCQPHIKHESLSESLWFISNLKMWNFAKNVALQSVKQLLWVLMAFKVVMCNEDKQFKIHKI